MMKIQFSKKLFYFLFLLSFLILASCQKQDNSDLDTKYLDKVQTVESTIKSFYEAISSKDGKPFDWEFVKYVIHPDGKFVRYGPNKDGEYEITYFSAKDYIERYKNYMENVGFYEIEIDNNISSFGPITHVWSAYESYEQSQEKPIIRGVNSFQMLNDGKRWWIVNNYWTRETDEYPILESFFSN